MPLDYKHVITLESKHGKAVVVISGETEKVASHVADSIRKLFLLPPQDEKYAIDDLMKSMGMS